MQNMPDFTEVMRLVNTPEGQRLLSMLQHSDSAVLSDALNNFRSGDYEKARDALSDILSTPEVRKLLHQFGR